jgi:hypothetical protein
LAIPNHRYLPSQPPQAALIDNVSSDISGELWHPVFAVRPGLGTVSAVPMLMPKTTMNENNRSVLRQNYIRYSGQLA